MHQHTEWPGPKAQMDINLIAPPSPLQAATLTLPSLSLFTPLPFPLQAAATPAATPRFWSRKRFAVAAEASPTATEDIVYVAKPEGSRKLIGR